MGLMGVYVDGECCSAWDFCSAGLARLIDPSAEASHKREQSQGFVSRWCQALDGADRIIAAGYMKVTDDAETLHRLGEALRGTVRELYGDEMCNADAEYMATAALHALRGGG